MTTKLSQLKKSNEEKKLMLENIKLDRHLKRLDAKNSYDAVAGSAQSAGGGNKRRQSSIETKEETGQDAVLRPYDRLHSLNLCRDAERNFSSIKSLIHQLKINVIGPNIKAQVNTGDDFGKEATAWINKKWMRNCDFRQSRRFAKLAQLIVAAKAREGDCLIVFDDDLIRDTGRILVYETDQICDVSDVAKSEEFKAKGWTQEDGIVRDQWGREVGYVVSKKRGQTSVTAEDVANIFPRDPDDEDKNMVKLIRAEYRLQQGRGISPLLSAIADALDCYEMRAKELQSAKLAASLAATVKRTESVEDFDDPRLDPDNENPDDSAGSSSTLPEEQEEPANYERMEKLTGGYIDYMDPGDEMVLHDIKRPNVAMKDFLDYVMDAAGSAFGMAHAYTRMKADTSYTAFRGDMVMTWVSFLAEQKDIENELLDWVAVRAIRWAIRKGLIKAAATEGWEESISWKLPTIPFVDEVKERTANALALKNGEKTFSDLLGPNWLEKFDQLMEELNAAKERGLPLSIFEQKSGGSAVTPDAENETEEEEGNTDEQDTN
jgi:capsid protein